MAYRRKSNVGAVVGGAIAFILLLGLVGGVAYKSEGFKNWDVKNWFNNQTSEKTDDEKSDSSSLSTEINSQNMTVRMLSKTITQEGYESLTYSFTITPANATRTEVQGTLSFVDGSEGVGNYLEFEIDNDLQTFTITKKADFDHLAKLVLSCESVPNVKATIMIDCVQKFLGYNNVNAKTYLINLNEKDAAGTELIQDLAHAIGADNLSEHYTISIDPYALVDYSIDVTGYVYGDATNALVDAGITIENDFLANGFNISSQSDVDIDEVEIVKQDLVDLALGEAANLTEAKMQELEAKTYFGLAFDFTATVSVNNEQKTATGSVICYLPTADVEFGIKPSALNVETTSVVF